MAIRENNILEIIVFRITDNLILLTHLMLGPDDEIVDWFHSQEWINFK